MTDPFTAVLGGNGNFTWAVNYHLGLGKPVGHLALPGRAALLGGPLFCSIFLFLYGYYYYLFLLLAFLLVAFAVDCLWRCRVKFWSRF